MYTSTFRQIPNLPIFHILNTHSSSQVHLLAFKLVFKRRKKYTWTYLVISTRSKMWHLQKQMKRMQWKIKKPWWKRITWSMVKSNVYHSNRILTVNSVTPSFSNQTICNSFTNSTSWEGLLSIISKGSFFILTVSIYLICYDVILWLILGNVNSIFTERINV